MACSRSSKQKETKRSIWGRAFFSFLWFVSFRFSFLFCHFVGSFHNVCHLKQYFFILRVVPIAISVTLYVFGDDDGRMRNSKMRFEVK